MVTSTWSTPRTRISRVPFELLLDHLCNASDRRDPGAEVHSLGFLKADRPVDERSQTDSIEEGLRTAWERHSSICFLHEYAALCHFSTVLMQPVHIYSRASGGKLCHELLEPVPLS